jgi:hypothetical protein
MNFTSRTERGNEKGGVSLAQRLGNQSHIEGRACLWVFPAAKHVRCTDIRTGSLPMTCSVLCVLVSSHGGWASGVVTDAGSGPLPPIDLRRLRAPVRSTINGTRLNKAIDGIRTLAWRRSTL